MGEERKALLRSNAKFQMSNQIQSANEMPKQVRHDESVILNSFQNPILDFAIDLIFEV